mmetsp:Transcript_10578/g.22721  ORF Transcript_10578/g.22721 Transcript_10578/m.22721 type:complete len:101 (+) Transcript_10578:802-1104(+)
MVDGGEEAAARGFEGVAGGDLDGGEEDAGGEGGGGRAGDLGAKGGEVTFLVVGGIVAGGVGGNARGWVLVEEGDFAEEASFGGGCKVRRAHRGLKNKPIF